MTTATHHLIPHPFLIASELVSKRWWKNHATLGSVLLHGSALLVAWALASSGSAVLPPPPVIELIRIQPDKPPPPPLVQPKPVPVKEKPLALAPPKPVPLTVPTPKTVQVAAEQAEAVTPPPAPAHVAPIGPVTPVAVPIPVAATPAPVTPKVIENEGIPTDYVNQVFARINRNTDYPREAKQRRQQGRVGYRLKLSAQGTLLGVEIQSSGHELLDDAARDAIQRAAPFGKLPELGASSYLLTGAIVFKIS